jgi:hypothetical protein
MPRLAPLDASGSRPPTCATAVAAEAWRTGIVPCATADTTSAAADQDEVDDVGRACGLAEEDAGALHCASEILARRDRHRAELTAPRRRV